MHLNTLAIVCTARGHAENGVIVRLLTEAAGLQAGYVNGGRSRRMRAALEPGSRVAARMDSRGEGGLARTSIELDRGRAALALDPLTLAINAWLTGLLATVLPEGEPVPRLYEAAEAMYALMEAAPDAVELGSALARFERLVLAELGFALDLSRCAATGRASELAFVSPRSGAAVSAAAGAPYAERLFTLPRFFLDGSAAATDKDVEAALAITMHFLMRDLVGAGHSAGQLRAARERLDARLARALARSA